eukprot:COSAG05_NODE_4815_length_1361_cov_2.124406_1_plen_254_part_10
MYTLRGTTNQVHDIMCLIPEPMAVQLAGELGILHNAKTGKRGVLAKVGWLKDLPPMEVIRLGGKLKHLRIVPDITSTVELTKKEEDGEYVDDFTSHEYVMTEGKRENTMYIIEEGMLRVERKTWIEAEGDHHAYEGEPIPLGKLREFDYFGELAVLAQEAPGVPFKRRRSAYIVTASVVLHTLTWDDMVALRKESPAIDRAVRECLDSIQELRPSMFKAEGVGGGDASNADVMRALAKQQAEIDGIKATLQTIA